MRYAHRKEPNFELVRLGLCGGHVASVSRLSSTLASGERERSTNWKEPRHHGHKKIDW